MTKYNHVRIDFDTAILSGVDMSSNSFRLKFKEKFQAGELIWDRELISTAVTQEGYVESRETPDISAATGENVDIVASSSLVRSHITSEGVEIVTAQEAVDISKTYTGSWYVIDVPFGVRVGLSLGGGRGSDGGGSYSSTDAVGAQGALVTGNLLLPETLSNEKVIAIPGRGGRTTTSPTTTSDSCTGAGGGGSYLVITRSDLTSENADLTKGIAALIANVTLSDSTTLAAGTMIQLIACAAGGSGGDDGRYAGTPAMPGSGEFRVPKLTNSKSVYDGAGFAGDTSASNYAKSVLYGAAGSPYNYARGGTSYAGFGGGGANADDTRGGRGGGVNRTQDTNNGQAYSWINEEYVTDGQGITGGNSEVDGFITLRKRGESSTNGTFTLTQLPNKSAKLEVTTVLPTEDASVEWTANGTPIDINSSLDWSTVTELTATLNNPHGGDPIQIVFDRWIVYNTSDLAKSVTVAFEEFFNNTIENPTIEYTNEGVLAGLGGKAIKPFQMVLDKATYDLIPKATEGEIFKLNRVSKSNTLRNLTTVKTVFTEPDIVSLKRVTRASGTVELNLLSPVKP